MAEQSAIEWCDSTFNPVIGCQKVSPACDHCYAEALMDTRYGKVEWGPHGERKRTSASNWQQPRRWQRQAAAFFAEHGRRRRVFCASLADVFDNKWPDGARDDLWQLIRETPDLDWLLLTKRPQNIQKMLPEFWGDVRRHVWIGISTENQAELERRSRALKEAFSERFHPAVLFSSAEPLLGPLDLRKSALIFDWVIVGGESGSSARPTHPDWIRSVRDQCAEAGMVFLMKQWGEWAPSSDLPDPMRFAQATVMPDGRVREWESDYPQVRLTHPEMRPMSHAGKKRAGRLLDGVTHDGFPQVRP